MQITSAQSSAHTLLIQEAGVPRSVGNAEGHHYIKTRNQSHRLLNLLPAAKLRRMMRKNNPHACCENRNVENRCRGIRAVSITIRPLSWTESVRKLFSVIRFRPITLFMPNTYYLPHIRKNQQYARICTTLLFYVLAPTCFGSSLPSSGSVLDPSELPEIQIGWVVCLKYITEKKNQYV
jgi:hypothetical protein